MIEINEDELIYPVTGVIGRRLENLNDVVGLTLLDFTNFHRLFVDKHGQHYVYKVKNPSSHIDELLNISNESKGG